MTSVEIKYKKQLEFLMLCGQYLHPHQLTDFSKKEITFNHNIISEDSLYSFIPQPDNK